MYSVFSFDSSERLKCSPIRDDKKVKRSSTCCLENDWRVVLNTRSDAIYIPGRFIRIMTMDIGKCFNRTISKEE